MRVGNNAVDLVAGCDHIGTVEERPVQTNGLSGAARTIHHLRVTGKETILLADIVIDFYIKPSSHRCIGTVSAVIQVGAVGGNQTRSAGVIRSVPRVMV